MDNYYGNICYCRRCNGVVHTIKKGDTLYLISKYYKVPIGEIMAANRNLNVYNLQIGDEICIPLRRPEPVENNFTEIPQNMSQPMPRSNMEGDMQEDMSEADFYSEMEEETVPASAEASPISGKSTMADIMGSSDMTLEDFVSYIRKML